MQEGEPVIGDLFTPEFIQNPYPTYRRIHEANPLFRLPESTTWIATRYQDCTEVLRDKRFGIDNDRRMRENLGSDYRNQPAYASLAHMMLVADPPDHTRLRKLVVKAFDARSIEQLRSRIRHIARQRVDAMQNQSSGDLMSLFAHPIPVEVICEMLGIPQSDRALFTDSDETAGRILDPTPLTPEELSHANSSTLDSAAYFENLCDQRRQQPQDDLLTALVESESEHGKLSREELTANISLLFGAGHETTVNLIGNGLLALYQNPAQLALLKKDPELMPNAIEELLRFDSSVQLSGRVALEDADLAGEEIRRGEDIITLVGAANRDPAVFENPDVLDITRKNIKPLSFGGGIHFCLGRQLARIEAAEALSELFERLPRLNVDTSQPRWKPTITLRGLTELQATW